MKRSSSARRVAAGVPEGGQFAAWFRDEAAVDLVKQPEHPAPRVIGIDPTWFARLAPHQQRNFVEDGTVSVRDSSGDPVEVRPGIVDENADWVYRNGQCLALAVTAAEECGGEVYCQRVDLDDTDEHDQPFYNLRHAYVLTPDGELLDIQGAHGGPDDLADDDDPDSAEPLVFDNPRDALAHFDGWLEDQDTVVAEPFAKRLLAEHRLRLFTRGGS